MNKKAQFQFAWIFAVIVGALILFLAFYFVGTTLLRQRYEQETIQAQSLDILLNPFAYLGSLGATTYNPLALPEESEILLDCYEIELGDLGYNEITLVSEEEAGIPKLAYDKYIFAPQPMKGKNFEALSKPLELPWRVADLIILWPADQEYCFTREISELERLNISTIKIKNVDECGPDSISVCINSAGCDITVSTTSKTVKKQGKTLHYTHDSLMYAAIFSDPVLYECNVQRLASRIYTESEIYEKKAILLAQKNCNTAYNLDSIKDAAHATFINPLNIRQIETAAETLKYINNRADCALF